MRIRNVMLNANPWEFYDKVTIDLDRVTPYQKGKLFYHWDGSPFYKFCPECGAEMRGG